MVDVVDEDPEMVHFFADRVQFRHDIWHASGQAVEHIGDDVWAACLGLGLSLGLGLGLGLGLVVQDEVCLSKRADDDGAVDGALVAG